MRKTGVNGAMVRKLRRREGWSQGELAEKLAIHRVTLARWESNLVEPPPEAAEQLGKLLENTQKELLEKTTRVETFQLDLLQKLDKALKLLGERRRS